MLFIDRVPRSGFETRSLVLPEQGVRREDEVDAARQQKDQHKLIHLLLLGTNDGLQDLNIPRSCAFTNCNGEHIPQNSAILVLDVAIPQKRRNTQTPQQGANQKGSFESTHRMPKNPTPKPFGPWEEQLSL